MILRLKVYLYNIVFVQFRFWLMLMFNKTIRKQLRNLPSIPVIIVNFNQLFYLKKLVDFFLKRKFENIIIIDNLSTYPPLLEYYKTLKGVNVEYMDDNYGHMVFFENKELQEKYGQGFYVLTDADIVPNENLPEDFMKRMVEVIIAEFNHITKVGFALMTEDIPNTYPFKMQVINWEKKFWEISYPKSTESYCAKIDTTFAIYKPRYPEMFNDIEFLKGIRIAGDFTARHGGWYLDPLNLTDEQKYYQKTSSSASSWLVKENGQLDDRHSLKYYTQQ